MSTSYVHFSKPVGTNPSYVLYEYDPNFGQYVAKEYKADWHPEFLRRFNEAMESYDQGFDPRPIRPLGFFGKWNFQSDVDPTPMIIEREIDTSTPNARFEERKHDGEIVIQDSYQKGKVRIVAPPTTSGGSFNDYGIAQITYLDFWPEVQLPGIPSGAADLGGGLALFCQCTMREEFVSGVNLVLPSVHPETVLRFLDECNRDIDSKAIVEMMAKLNEGTMDLLTELAELPETIKLGVDTLRLFSQKGKNLRRLVNEIAEESGDPKKLARLGDKIANARLLYRYGILPLSYSLEDIKNVLKEKFKAEFVKTSKSSNKVVDMDLIDSDFTFSGGVSAEFKCFAKRALDPTDAFQQYQKVFGMSLPRTLWELTPWSLVVDWFTNAGDALLALSPMPNIGEGSTISWKTGCEGVLTSKTDPSVKIYISYTDYYRVSRQMQDNICLIWNPVLNRARYFDGLAFSWQLIRRGLRSIK